MPNWTLADVDLRNIRVFGQAEPTEPLLLEDRKAQNVPEALIELECCKLLAEDGWRILKTDPVSDKSRGKGFGELGMADTLALRYSQHKPAACEVAWFEWKARGGRVKKHQIAWHTKEQARGAMTLIAGVDFPASVEGFRDWYASSGLQRHSAW